jgi:hypothetical protein
MSSIQQQASTGRTPSPSEAPASENLPPQTGWTGWVMFGGAMMVLLGAFHAIAGVTALTHSAYYVAKPTDLVVHVSYTTWGWVHLAVGLVAVATGMGLFRGQLWARVLGVLVAAVSALLNFVFIPAYPIWSVLMVTFDIVVIYAIAAHGAEMKTVRALRNS